MIVEDPSGETWRIKRRWLPWRLRKRDVDIQPDGSPGIAGADDLVIALVVFIVMLLVLLFAPIVVVLAIFVAELMLLLLLLPLFVVLRAAFVARWPIEAWHGDNLVHAEAVRGWGSSHRRMVELADNVRLGTWPVPSPDLRGPARFRRVESVQNPANLGRSARRRRRDGGAV